MTITRVGFAHFAERKTDRNGDPCAGECSGYGLWDFYRKYAGRGGIRRIAMDFYKVPIGFGMALAMNEPAMAAYGVMTKEQQKRVLDKARNARSEAEMRQIVSSMVN